MNDPLSPAAKKAYEVSYALFRVAAVLPSRSFAEALQQEGLHLLWNAIRHSHAEAESGIHALYYLVSFGRDTGTIHPENAEVLIRQLESLSFLVASSFYAEGQAAGVAVAPMSADLEGIFSSSEQPASENSTVKVSPSKANRPAATPQSDLTLGPAQKERQAMILEKIRQSGNCRTGELQAVLPDLSERTLRYDLQRLVEQGKIERGGAGPASWYRLKDEGGMKPATESVVGQERNVSQASTL